jgi:hypothetical protein
MKELKGPELRKLKPGQCLLVLSRGIGDLHAREADVWLDNLYLRVNRSETEAQEHGVMLQFRFGKLWMTNITIQGDGGPMQALHAHEHAAVSALGVPASPAVCAQASPVVCVQHARA